MAVTSRVALVTGASSGIGRACADRLDAAGWVVIGASRRGSSSGSWSGLVMDVDDDNSVHQGVAALIERHGRVDALVASAGWGLAGALEQTTVEEAKAQLETNFFGVVRSVQAVLPTLRSQGAGRVVLISSIGGVIGIPFQAFYSASKFALEGMAEAMAYEVAPFGIAVTLVEPGNIVTDFTTNRKMAKAPDTDGTYREALEKAVKVMERDERNGAAPANVAETVQRVLSSRHPPRRVSVGKAGERVGLLAKRVLPFRLFEAGAKGSLGIS
ncbi:MAG: SDR family oxidoreductase [Nitrososphaerales archaeon]